MVQLHRIVVPVDFTDRSTDAVRYAGALARHFRSHLTLLHVVEPLKLEFAMMDPPQHLFEQMMSARSEKLEAELEGLRRRELDGLNANTVLLDGEPAAAIVEFCDRNHVDLLVMPTRGRNPLRHFMVGSVAAKVLHDAHCAVLTGVHMEREFEFPALRLRRVVAAVDLGPHTEAVLQWAGRLAGECNADLTAIHVVNGNGAATAAAQDKLHGLPARLGLQADAVVRSGEPHKQVAIAAKGLDADLVVIGRGTVDGLLGRLRAHSYAIVRESPCPVLSV